MIQIQITVLGTIYSYFDNIYRNIHLRANIPQNTVVGSKFQGSNASRRCRYKLYHLAHITCVIGVAECQNSMRGPKLVKIRVER